MEDSGHHLGRYHRSLIEVFGVGEDEGVYVLIAGMILVALTVIGCCYCKVYDPLKTFYIKMYKRCCTRKPKAAAPPKEEAPGTPERRHWYLNKTLQIDRLDRDELGPQANRKGLQGGWYGARNGGFDV